MSFFDITVLVLLTLQLLLLAAIFAKVCLPDEEKKADMLYERDLEREREKNSIDEGITNIMSYSVNGKTGFEHDE